MCFFPSASRKWSTRPNVLRSVSFTISRAAAVRSLKPWPLRRDAGRPKSTRVSSALSTGSANSANSVARHRCRRQMTPTSPSPTSLYGLPSLSFSCTGQWAGTRSLHRAGRSVTDRTAKCRISQLFGNCTSGQ